MIMQIKIFEIHHAHDFAAASYDDNDSNMMTMMMMTIWDRMMVDTEYSSDNNSADPAFTNYTHSHIARIIVTIMIIIVTMMMIIFMMIVIIISFDNILIHIQTMPAQFSRW